MRVVALVNQTAGAVSAGKLTPEALRDAFARAGVAAEVRFLGGGEIAAAIAAAAGRGGVDAVVVGGGDSTLRCAAAQLAGGEIPLGVLPLGTLNHFARDLGIAFELAAAVAVIAARHVLTVDVGEVNGEVFLNTSVLGFYPRVVLERDRERRRLGRGKWLAALVALVRVLPRARSLAVSIEIDGTTVERRTRFVFTGTREYTMNVFAQLATAGERSESGLLHLYVARGTRRWQLLWLGLRALFQDVSQTDHFDCWRAPAFTLDLRGARTPVFLDGEVVELAPPLRYRSLPRKLKVLAPDVPVT
jgi:diacylglycerol kinase family enzyme